MIAPRRRKRGAFGSSLGFIFAAAGSAIGLGNIWRFPYTAGENGGGAFVLVYLICVVFIGVPVLLAEMTVGRSTQRNPVGAFKALCPDSLWPFVGGLGVLTGFGILAFYSVVAGWTLGYLYKTATGAFSVGMTLEESKALFGGLIGDPVAAIGLTGIFMLFTIVVVRGGVSGGIERVTKILMPLFFVMLVIMAVRAMTLPGAGQGIGFLFSPDFSKLTPKVCMNALGQALFSLSLGMGALITYGSYLPKKENLVFAGVSVAVFDTLIAILAGLIIFPALFAVGAKPDAGTGLVFEVLPTIFAELPAGELFGMAFYVLLAIAALTSTISLLEVVVSYFVDELSWTREKAVWIIGGCCFLIAIPSALSAGASEFLSSLPGGGFLDLQSIIWGNFSLSIGALLLCVFVGWRWGIPNAIKEMTASGHDPPGTGLWGFLVRFACPIAVLIVLGFIVYTGEYF